MDASTQEICLTDDAVGPTNYLQEQLARFGIDSFRPGQQEVIQTVMRGDDCICVMPTGGGKSLCYQLPAISRPGVCLVVSPLIALMKDQVDQLQGLGIRAELINSTLSFDEQEQRLTALAQGKLDLLYVAPERFRGPRFRDILRQSPVQLLAIDEAHCISEWGHDFRHEYSRLGEYRSRLGNPQTIALTATATEEVRQDIASQLGLKDPRTFVAGFARPNLYYEVRNVGSSAEKMNVMQRFLQENPGSGIIYASTRRACEEVAATLTSENRTNGRRVGVYHAGLPLERRNEVQESFMGGLSDIIVATNAFGMGINKSDVRFVIHYQIPGSIEAYYQEAGRAGRDGQPARCLLLLSDSDRYIQQFFIESSHPSAPVVAKVYDHLRSMPNDPIEVTQQELQEVLGLSLSAEGVGTCERILEKHGVLERLEPQRNMAAIKLDTDLPSLLDLLPRQAKMKRKVLRAVERIAGNRRFERIYLRIEDVSREAECDVDVAQRVLRELRELSVFDFVPPFRGRAIHLLRRGEPFSALGLDLTALEARRAQSLEKLNRVFRFARSRSCRQQQILQYFGDDSSTACGHCDSCESNNTPLDPMQSSPESWAELRQSALMVLSGVARCRRGFGKTLIAAMLCGAQTKKIQQRGLDRLSTFGLLKPLRQAEVVQFIDELISAELLESSEVERHRPILRLTSYGTEVMLGRAEWMPTRLKLAAPLMERLTHCGTQRAPVVKKPNQPIPRAETTALPMAPSSKIHARDVPTRPPTPPFHFVATAAIPAISRPGYYWTWRLLQDGYSVLECAAIRQSSESQIWAEALRAGREGLTVAPEWLLAGSELVRLQDFYEKHSDENGDLQTDVCLPSEIPRRQWEWFVVCQNARREIRGR